MSSLILLPERFAFSQVRQNEGWGRFLVYLSSYRWLEEEAAIISPASLVDLQMAIARLDWQLWDKLWHREITDQEIEVLLEWQSGRAEAMVAGGILIASLELYTFLRKNEMSPCRGDACRFGHRAGIRGSALLGLFAGVLPCLPLLGVLTFTALYTRDLWEGALYGLAFGSGKLFSPLIMLGILAGSAPALLSRYGRAFSYFTKLCGVVFILIGGSLIIPGLLPLW